MGADRALRLAAGVTLVAFLLHPPGPPMLRIAIQALAALGLLWPRALLAPAVWAALAAVTAARVALDWPLADNHAYLASAWCLSIALAGATADPTLAARRSARALIVVVFALAVLWKGYLSPDYRDGTFFRVTALVDQRFEATVERFGGLSSEARAANRAALLASLRTPDAPPPRVATSPRFDRFVSFSTAWTLLIELAIASTFAVGALPAWARHGPLVLFCATTFAVAPVPGFGWLLVALGLAQVGAHETRWQAAYLAAAALILAQQPG